MNFPNQLYFPDRKKWRAWLIQNHDKEKEAWLIYYKKHTGKPQVSYEEAVEEALCFGWIDSTVRRIDDERYMQRFTPRNPSGKWSRDNILRVKKMIEQKRMTPSGLVKYQEILDHPERLVIIDKPVGEVRIPDDLLNDLQQNPTALNLFTGFSVAYKHLCIRWIDAAKKEETRIKRIREIVDLSAKGAKIGLK
jgi:uncharacterized protein YdeI (YjbR/CyaY-like superfamily)